MDAPEKIYLEAIYPDNGVLPNGLNYTPSPTDIEYARTDTFIKKACDWLINHNDYICGSTNGIVKYDMKQLVEDFKTYMKGE